MLQAELLTFPSNIVTIKTAENIADLIKEKLEEAPLTIFLSGGSAIEMYKELFTLLGQQISGQQAQHIQLALVDERFGPYGHPDSNEQQLKEKGVVEAATHQGMKFIGMLHLGNPDAQTALSLANKIYQQLLAENSYKLLLLGLGDDGHTAGWLPTHSDERFQTLYASSQPVVYYEVDPQDSNNPYHRRLTISTSILAKINQVIIYTKGTNKKAAIQHFIAQDTPVHRTPALAVYASPTVPILITDQTI